MKEKISPTARDASEFIPGGGEVGAFQSGNL
jgi:hypothetical protein